MNMARAELLGWGLQVAYQELSEESLSKAINEVLDNRVYSDNIKLISQRLKDQPQKPMEKAIYWIEYVLRNDGAHYMQTSAQYLNFVEYYNLDIYLMFGLITLLVIAVPIVVIRKILRCFRSPQKIKVKKN
jgi:glucuronosyltransferase